MDNAENKAELWQDFYIIKCPHCGIKIIVHTSEMNCRIFRCSDILNPHANEIECRNQYRKDPSMGCCMPFKVLEDYSVVKCSFKE